MKTTVIAREKTPKYGQQTATARVIKRNVKGELSEAGSETSSADIYKDDRERKAGTGSGTFEGSAAPRTGGVAITKTGMATGGSKKQIKSAKIRVKRSGASPQAKAAAQKIYR